jgi:hypothetical protein
MGIDEGGRDQFASGIDFLATARGKLRLHGSDAARFDTDIDIAPSVRQCGMAHN